MVRSRQCDHQHNQPGSGSDSNTLETRQNKRYVRKRGDKKHRLAWLMPFPRRRFQSSLFTAVDTLFLMFVISLSTLIVLVSASFVGSQDYESKTTGFLLHTF